MDHNAMGMDPCDNQNDAIFNITTDKRTHVDARTGLFEAHVPLPSVTGNVGYGPVVDLSLYYSPVVNNHAALGDGWSFAFTTWYEKNSDLTLHTGEALRLEKGKDLITPAVMVTWSDSGNTLTVERKDGRVEILRKPEAGRVWVPARLTTDGYRYLDFTWATVAQTVGKDTHHQVRLTGIRDPDRTLLDVTYGPDEMLPATVTLTYWPGTDETLRFVLDIKDVALQSVTAPEGTRTTFGYLEHPTCGWLLNAVETFEGLKEDVAYADNGLKFQDQPKLSALPAVATHTVTPRAGGAAVIDHYRYMWETDAARKDIAIPVSQGTPPFDAEVFKPSYQTQVRNGERLIVYRYLATHEMWMESTIQDGHTKTKIFGLRKLSSHAGDESTLGKLVLTYYDNIPREFGYSLITENGLGIQMDRTTRTSYTHGHTSRGMAPEKAFRNMYITHEYTHRFSEPKESVDRGLLGTMSDSRLERVEAAKLLRLPLRNVDMEYFADRGELERLTKISYTYTEIDGIHRKKMSSLVTSRCGKYSAQVGIGQAFDYFEENNFKKGRQKTVKQGNVKNNAGTVMFVEDDSTRIEFDYELSELKTALTTRTTETRDGVSRCSSETRSVLSGRLIGQVDADDNEVSYTYDQHGRLCTHTTAAQSPIYRQTTRYTYPVTGRVEIEEPGGVKRAITSDGRDQTVQEQLMNAATNEWRDVHVVKYDDKGRRACDVRHDYLDGGVQTAESCNTSYDAWGEACVQSFSDGRILYNHFDPSTRIREEWTGTPFEKHRKRTSYSDDDAIDKVEWLDEDGYVRCFQQLSYESNGLLIKANTQTIDGPSEIRYNHDDMGRLVS